MKTNGVLALAALVFFLVVVPLNVERGFTTSWQTELLAAPKGGDQGPPSIPPGQDKDKDKGNGNGNGNGKGNNPKSVPEPSTLILLGMGLAAGGAYSFFRRQKGREQE